MAGAYVLCWDEHCVVLLAKDWTLAGLTVSLVELPAMHKAIRVACFDCMLVVIHWLLSYSSCSNYAW